MWARWCGCGPHWQIDTVCPGPVPYFGACVLFIVDSRLSREPHDGFQQQLSSGEFSSLSLITLHEALLILPGIAGIIYFLLPMQ